MTTEAEIQEIAADVGGGAATILGQVDEAARNIEARWQAEHDAQTRESFEQEETAESDAEEAVEQPTTSPETPAAKQAPPPAAPTSLQQEIQTLAQKAAAERERWRKQQASAPAPDPREAALAERERRLAEREAMFENPDAVMNLVEQKVGADRFKEWLVQSQDPTKRAEFVANGTIAPLMKEFAELKAEIRRRDEAERAAVERSKGEQNFIARLSEVQKDAPLLNAAMKANQAKYLKRVHAKADELREAGEPVTLYNVILAVEEDLSEAVRLAAPSKQDGASDTKQPKQPKTNAPASARVASPRGYRQPSPEEQEVPQRHGAVFEEQWKYDIKRLERKYAGQRG